MADRKHQQKPHHPVANNDHALGIVRSLRRVKPAHYMLKIVSFSLLSETRFEKHESGVFEAGGYKWKLCLYPKGNKKGNGDGHISLYLIIADTNTLQCGWEVNVNFKFFVYDHIRDTYLTIQDYKGRVSRFHQMKTEYGFGQLISLDAFNDPSNGYLMDDSCAFGAEVFVIGHLRKSECLTMMNKLHNDTYTWKIEKFSGMLNRFYYSEEFVVEGHKWKLLLYPNGNSSAKGTSLSVFLELANLATLPPGKELYVKFKLQICDQSDFKHHEIEGEHHFCPQSDNWGFSNFLSLRDLKDASKGFLVNDTLIIKVQIMTMSIFKDL